MSSHSISSAKASGVHLKQSRGSSRLTIVKILPRILKHRSSPHCRFSVACGKNRQNSRMVPTFIGLISARRSVSQLSMHDLKLHAEVSEKARLLALWTAEPMASLKNKKHSFTKFIAPAEPVISHKICSRPPVRELIDLRQQFERFRCLVPHRKAQNVAIDSAALQEPCASLNVQLQGADFFGDLEWQKETRACIGKSSPYRIVGIVEFKLRVSRDVQLVLIVFVEAPLHTRQRLAQSALQRTAVRTLEQVRHLIFQLYSRADAVVDVNNRHAVNIEVRSPLQRVGNVDLPVIVAGSARVVGLHRRSALGKRRQSPKEQRPQDCHCGKKKSVAHFLRKLPRSINPSPQAFIRRRQCKDWPVVPQTCSLASPRATLTSIIFLSR